MCGIDTLLPRHWSVDFVNQFLLLLKFFFFLLQGEMNGVETFDFDVSTKKKKKENGGEGTTFSADQSADFVFRFSGRGGLDITDRNEILFFEKHLIRMIFE